MNIAILPSAFHPSLGGVEELTRQLARELQRQGHRAIIITNRWPRDLPEKETIDGLSVYRLPMRFPDGSFKSWATYHVSRNRLRNRLAAILRQERIEVLHVQCVSSQAHYATWAAQTLDLPLVVTLQGELTMDATQLYQRSERARGLMRKTLDSADAVTACSQQTLDEAEAFMGRPWRVPTSVIWNGVNVDELAAATPYVHARPYVLAIGRHVTQKGFDVLLRAFAQYVATGGQFDLILAGDGPERANLQQLITELKLCDKVHLVGRADRVTAASLFAGCEFFVLPSRHEPFGIVNLEAMAAGKAVVATRVGGVAEIVKNHETGLLVPANSLDALAAALSQLSSNAELRARLGELGRERAVAFCWPTVARNYFNCYQISAGTVSMERLRR